MRFIKLLLWATTILKLTSAAVLPKEMKSDIVRAVISQEHNSLVKRDGKLYSDNPSSYYVTVNIGTPPQPIKLIIDTGSSDIVMPTTECPKDHCSEFVPFDPNKSSTFQKDGRSMERAYVRGKATGYFGTETVTIGDVTLSNFTVGFATDVVLLPFGILGLAYPSLTQYSYNSFPFQLYQEQKIKQGMFSIFFDPKSSDANNKGEIIFGGSDKSKYTGDLVAVPSPPLKNSTSEFYAYWELIGQSTSVLGKDGKALQTSDFTEETDKILFVDTGASRSYLPKSSVDIIVTAFKSEDIKEFMDMYTVSCNQPYYSDYTVQFTVGSSDKPVHLNVPLQDMIVPGLNSTCLLGIEPSDGLNILGLSIIQNFYMEFDFVQHQISFATGPGSKATVAT